MPSLLLCCVGRRPTSFSKQHEQLENGRTERRACHTAVTTRCGSAELTGDGSRRFPVVRTGRESLRDSQVRPLFEWGSSGANANARRPARQSFRFSSPNTMARLGEQEIGESAPDAGVGVLWPSREVMPTRRGGRAECPLTSSFITDKDRESTGIAGFSPELQGSKNRCRTMKNEQQLDLSGPAVW
jgi:hypothetical protein